jgi:hypothetical protein
LSMKVFTLFSMALWFSLDRREIAHEPAPSAAGTSRVRG